MPGLLAVGALHELGRRAVVLEAAKSLGGRIATRHIDGHVLDAGAQFFTVRSERFTALVEGWLREGIAAEWSRGFLNARGERADDGHPRYRGVAGMAALPEHLARGVPVRLGVPVARVDPEGEDGWRVETTTGETIRGRSLLLTPPVPESLALVDAGTYGLPPEQRLELEQVRYAPCITVLAVLDGPSGLSEPGGVQVKGEPIDWLADNHLKGVSPRASSITIHSSPAFARERWGRADDEVADSLLRAAGRHVRARAVETRVLRWPFSQPTEPYPEACLQCRSRPPLVFAGDAFGGPRVEGASLSGLAAADRLLTVLG